MGWIDPQIYNHKAHAHEIIQKIQTNNGADPKLFYQTLMEIQETFMFWSDRIPTDGIPVSLNERKRAREAIMNAEEIVFLGYGFNEQTNKILFSETDLNSLAKKMSGTSYYLPEKKIKGYCDFGASFENKNVFKYVKHGGLKPLFM